MTLMTAMTMKCRGSLNGVAALFLEMIDSELGREYGEHKSDKERCRREARSAYDLFPNISCCSSGLPSRSALSSLYSRGTSS
jgi:hypothetical protein